VSKASEILTGMTEQGELTQEMVDSIDWKALEAHLGKLIGAKVTLVRTVTSGRRGDYIKVSSKEDFSKKCGVMSSVYDWVKLGNFGGGLTEDGHYWLLLNFSWTYKSGGSNSTELVTAWWNFAKKKWIFN